MTVCVILAAGRSQRMAVQKLTLRIGEATLLERAFEAAGEFPVVAVVARELVSLVRPGAGLTIVVNDQPDRGMTHSLSLAEAAIADCGVALAVLLADTPLVDAALVRRIIAARGEADVAYPVREGVGGHPVVFGPRARAALRQIKEGDTLRTLRDDPRWRRVEVAIEDEAPFLDVDTLEDLARAETLVAGPVEPLQQKASS